MISHSIDWTGEYGVNTQEREVSNERQHTCCLVKKKGEERRGEKRIHFYTKKVVVERRESLVPKFKLVSVTVQILSEKGEYLNIYLYF